MEQFSRTEMLLGKEAMSRLADSHVLVFGLGGVGGMLVEALARAGVGKLTIVDNDAVAPSNLNRQVIATQSSLGMKKTEAAKKRILDINPLCQVTAVEMFYLPEQADFITEEFDYIADAIDTVTAKLSIAERAQALGIPLISCMGTGNKLFPELLSLGDIFETSVCPLCRVMRTELRKRGIQKLTVVYSKEEPKKPLRDEATEGRRSTPGSVAWVPPVAGMMMAGKIVRDLVE